MIGEVKQSEYSLTLTGPSTTREDYPRQRVFSKGRCWKHLTTCESIFKITAGTYVIAASAGLAYIINDAMFNPDPESAWGRMNYTFVDYGFMGGTSLILDIGFMTFAFLGAGIIGKTCYDGIKEGRVQRGQTPLLNEIEDSDEQHV
ncbi:MAG: hypothetical protein H0X29_06905 [Parachlamydiaceae bacterium]|nr:hypothetical protein [Parachlamydiaceae bacterium]